jgi:pantetheine-phosphate adenylyltransferase
VVAVSHNPTKNPIFSVQERVQLMRTMVDASLPADISKRVEVCVSTGLVVDAAKQQGAHFLVRGLRAFSDFEFEFRMALINRKLSGIETAFLMADERMSHISSTVIREMAKSKVTLPGFVVRDGAHAPSREGRTHNCACHEQSRSATDRQWQLQCGARAECYARH